MEDDTTDLGRTFARRLNRTTYSPVVSLVALVAGLLGLVVILLRFTTWVDHSNHVIQRAQNVQKSLLEIQTSVRGFYLSGDPSFLEPYRLALPTVTPALADLNAAVGDNPDQTRSARQISDDVDRWLSNVQQSLRTINPIEGERPSPDRMRLGRAQSEQVFKDIDAFLANERQLADLRAVRVASATHWGLLLAGIATAIVGYIQCMGMRRRLAAITGTYRDALRLARERRQRVQSLLKELDDELKAVGEIQRSLLPTTLPQIAGLDLAASYQTSRRAGGDYYDFFKLPPEYAGDDRIRYGILIADVSGHGTPAAVLMAVTHSIAHGFAEPGQRPDQLLEFVNRRLCQGYTTPNAAFVTAFYAIYDPDTGELTYSSAGHNPPRLRRAHGSNFIPLDEAQSLPLGVSIDEPFVTASCILRPGDTLVMYTDGITEARDANDQLLGVERLDVALASPSQTSHELLHATLAVVQAFDHDVVHDDRTLLILRVQKPHELPADDVPVEVQFNDLAPANAG